ncbi:MAG: uracil-DNA glycosylase [Chloroflexota bacterium]
MPIDRFILQLRRTKPPADCVNPWRGRSAVVKMRQANLSLYLKEMAAKKPKVVLVGEAPGYRGCGLTGVPFTSERILAEGAAGLFGVKSGYKISEGYLPMSEASATIVWNVLSQFPQNLPLIWNAFPFHPHKPNNVQTNRPPKVSELSLGAIFLRKLLNLYPTVQTVVAVGNRADDCLNRMGVEHLKIRHPSHGGKREFVMGLENILQT